MGAVGVVGTTEGEGDWAIAASIPQWLNSEKAASASSGKQNARTSLVGNLTLGLLGSIVAKLFRLCQTEDTNPVD